jgi:predicted transcriptional regulator
MTNPKDTRQPMTIAQLAVLFGRSPRQIRYAIRSFEIQPKTLIQPKRYNPDDLIPALGQPLL